jgi:glutamate/tyrosine decarboxylase-like PLP-dependent enzyme
MTDVTKLPTSLLDHFADIEAALNQAQQLALEHLRGVDSRPVSRLATWDEMKAALDEPLPETGTAPDAAIAEWAERAAPGIVGSAGPRYHGFVLGGSTPAALGGDWLASALDQMTGMWSASPAAAQTEQVVLRWLKELFGVPASWGGAITTGGTMSNLTGLAAARQWAGEQLGFNAAEDGLAGHPVIPVVSSTEIHASARKALANLGLGRKSVKTVAAPNGIIDLKDLERTLAAIEGPVIVIANSGEVNTGQFDDLNGMADVLEKRGNTWLHVDGAFGLFAAASPGLKHLMAGMERADSIASDAHKWLNVPYDCGFMFVRDQEYLLRSFSTAGAYLVPVGGDGPDPVHGTAEMSRRFRALSIWCALKAAGRSGYRELVERCVMNAADLADWITETNGVELMNPATLNIVCFRFTADGLSGEEQDVANRAALRRMQENGRVFCTPTLWNGRTAIRAAFSNWSTTSADVDLLKEEIARVIPS